MDSLRPGHEVRFHPGETSLRMADVLVISKAGDAHAAAIAELKASADDDDPKAMVVTADLAIHVQANIAATGLPDQSLPRTRPNQPAPDGAGATGLAGVEDVRAPGLELA